MSEEVADVPVEGGQPQPRTPLKRDMVRRAAIAVMMLGDELARDIFRSLSPTEVEYLLKYAESLSNIDPSEVAEIMQDFTDEVDRQVLGISGHDGLLQEMAENALGRDRLAAILGRNAAGATERLRNASSRDPLSFAQALMREHPQVVAGVMSILDPPIAAMVLAAFPPELKTSTVSRLATLETVPAKVITDIADVVGRELLRPDQAEPVAIDGSQNAVEILKKIGVEDEAFIFESLAAIDAELAAELKAKMFVFEDLVVLNDREVQGILREVDGRQLSMALKGATPKLKAYILSNMSSRAAQIVLDDIDALGPVGRTQVNEAQEQILEIVFRMAEEGRVNLRPDTDE
jgi:flagellar motor switch protein FliG